MVVREGEKISARKAKEMLSKELAEQLAEDLKKSGAPRNFVKMIRNSYKTVLKGYQVKATKVYKVKANENTE